MSKDAVSEQPEAQVTGVEAAPDEQPEAGEATGDAEASPAAEEAEAAEISAEEQIAALQEELALAQAQAQEYLDRLQRTTAEFQNSRRRQERQLAEAIERANGELVRRLLPILDDFDLAFEHAPSGGAAEGEDAADGDNQLAWVEGFRQIQRKLLDLLGEHGVTLIDADGEFDPTRHEAVTSEPSDEVESGHIIAVLRAGYEYKGQVLRPTLVRVAM
jgi:molecular chaperone GrpE